MLVSIIIPTLNERDALGFLFGELQEALTRIPEYEFEIIIVDDGSIDGTREFVSGFKNFPWTLRLMERKKRGLATAVLEGFKNSSGEILGVMDADLSHPPALIPKLLDALKNADVAIGSRHIYGGGVEEWPLVRRMFSEFATLLARPISGGMRDPLSGFFFIKKSALKVADLKPFGYKILLEILVRAAPLKAVEIPYIFRNRSVGKSKLNWRVSIDYFLHLVRLYSFTARQLCRKKE
ncbi:polyprenol monophosphomannose synthase [Candidatus Uhrbacteria bacterium]|nr:polyprenol monophosphomannose synthase [Candidatus Uhrbacteria bacterium]